MAIAVLESARVSAPTAALSAATRSAAASVACAPDSSSSAGQTRAFQSPCIRSHTGEPTSPYANSASGVAPSSDSFANRYRGNARNAFHWLLPSPQTTYLQFRHVSLPGSSVSSHDLKAVAFAGGFDVYVEVIATSSQGCVRGGDSASSLSVSTSFA